MFRLAHISDVHLGPLPEVTLRQLASKRITGYVNWRVSRHHQHGAGTVGEIIEGITQLHPSHLAVTGDLINIGLDSEIEQARDWLATLGDARDVSVVPGNHDAYVPGAFARACNAWEPWIRDDQPAIRSHPFPYLRIRGDAALIGVSTARASAPFMATGYFRHRQALALETLLQETGRQGLCRIIMIHHPPVYRAIAFHKRLIGIDLFQHVVREHGAELVLHGHTHLPTLSWIDVPGSKIPVVGVSAAGQSTGGIRPPAQFNLFDIDGAPGAWRIKLERHGLGGPQPGIGLLSTQLLHTS